MKILFIINPISGIGKKQKLPGLISKYLDSKQFAAKIKFTQKAGDASTMAAQAVAEGYTIVVAVGGDGTVNEIATSLIGTEVCLGIIPAGSGNGLARHLKIPLKAKAAVRLLNNHQAVKIDTGLVNGHTFLCAAGLGFDAHISQLFSMQKKRGFLKYLKLGLREFMRYKPLDYVVENGRESQQYSALFISIANGSQFGNNAKIAPSALINDGLFDICILKPVNVWRAFLNFFKLFSGKIENSEDYIKIQTDGVKVSGPFNEMHVDGEVHQANGEIEVKVVPKSIYVAVEKILK